MSKQEEDKLFAGDRISGESDSKGASSGKPFRNKRFLFALIIAGILVALIIGAQLQLSSKTKEFKNYTDLLQDLENDNVKEVTIEEQYITWTLKTGEENKAHYVKVP